MKVSGVLAVMAALLVKSQVDAAAVFAHFIVGNADAFAVSDWESDMQLAQQASIDAFALNIAADDPNNAASLSNAFQAANNVGFKCFFSFDYEAWGTWDASAVVSLINEYGPNGAYYQYNDLPLVSTFEGFANAGDWSGIKSQTGGVFFMPDWSSQSAATAVGTGVVDGLFSWAAWPNGPTDMSLSTSRDYEFVDALDGMPYMMPASPWFFTNLPGYSKNWLWRGDDLWYDRWQEVFTIEPEFVEIITWNDFGESHYIGPIHTDELGLFGPSDGDAPYDYAENNPHDGWRQFLPYVIAQYKNGGTAPAVSAEGLTVWYRLNPGQACETGGTTGNTASQGQTEYPPYELAQDEVFYSALLQSDADVSVSIGGASVAGATWTATPGGSGAGLYHGSAPFGGNTGAVTVVVSRNGQTVAEVQGVAITTSCEDGIENWNAWVGSSSS